MMPGDCLDNVAELYGATVYTVNTDVLCRGDGGDVDDAMFLNLSTSKGDLTFTCYNKHNGYYSHSATVTRIDRNSSDLSKTGEVLLSDFL